MIQENCNERRGTNSSHGCMNDWQFYNQTHEKAIHKPLSRLLNSLFCLSSSFSCLGYMILGQKGRSFLILPIGMLNYGKPYLVHSFCTLKLDRNSERVDEWLHSWQQLARKNDQANIRIVLLINNPAYESLQGKGGEHNMMTGQQETDK